MTEIVCVISWVNFLFCLYFFMYFLLCYCLARFDHYGKWRRICIILS